MKKNFIILIVLLPYLTLISQNICGIPKSENVEFLNTLFSDSEFTNKENVVIKSSLLTSCFLLTVLI